MLQSVRRAGRQVTALTPVKAGGTATLRLTLRRPGRYELVCTVADHEARGMRATLRVTARPVRRATTGVSGD